MDYEQTINYLDKDYKILYIEQEYLIHPAAFGYLPLSKATQRCNFAGSYHIEGYRLYLDRLVMNPGAGTRSVFAENNERQFDFDHFPVNYNGAILIGANPMKEFGNKGKIPACFSYQEVKELIFEDGVLITTVEQSKAMQRIRKNIDLGLRSLDKNRDNRCIQRFMDSVFIGDYKPFRLQHSRMKYLKNMQKGYSVKI
jgi:hypothetical protein